MFYDYVPVSSCNFDSKARKTLLSKMHPRGPPTLHPYLRRDFYSIFGAMSIFRFENIVAGWRVMRTNAYPVERLSKSGVFIWDVEPRWSERSLAHKPPIHTRIAQRAQAWNNNNPSRNNASSCIFQCGSAEWMNILKVLVWPICISVGLYHIQTYFLLLYLI